MQKNKRPIQWGAFIACVGVWISLFVCRDPLVAIWQFVSLLWIMCVEQQWDFNQVLLKEVGRLREVILHPRTPKKDELRNNKTIH